MSKHICHDKSCMCSHPSQVEVEQQHKEYMPHGPAKTNIVLPQPFPEKQPIQSMKLGFIADNFTAKPGWLYDAHTGLCLGPASDKMKAEHKSGDIWERIIAGMKQKVMIG